MSTFTQEFNAVNEYIETLRKQIEEDNARMDMQPTSLDEIEADFDRRFAEAKRYIEEHNKMVDEQYNRINKQIQQNKERSASVNNSTSANLSLAQTTEMHNRMHQEFMQQAQRTHEEFVRMANQHAIEQHMSFMNNMMF